MSVLKSVHHVAIICSDYAVSKSFYTEVLGCTILAEHYRAERKSWKLDLALNDQYLIELFSFPNAPQRVSQPEACGLRHLAFAVNDVEEAAAGMRSKGVITEPIRIDEFTGRPFTFLADPDGLPIELYEI